MRICIPIVAESTALARKKMERAFAAADLVEMRIDRFREIHLPKLLEMEKGKILVTNRRTEEGGSFSGTEEKRVQLLKEAVQLGAGYVDIEAATDIRLIRELRDMIRKSDGETRLIVSSHDLIGTPGSIALKKKIETGRSLGADIVKIVTTARAMEDNLKVLRLIPLAAKKGMPVIAFCMGTMGRVSRVIAPLLGSFLTFASLDQGEESAPGQMTVKEMDEILKRLGFKA